MSLHKVGLALMRSISYPVLGEEERVENKKFSYSLNIICMYWEKLITFVLHITLLEKK